MTGCPTTNFTVFGMYVDRKRILLGWSEVDVARTCDITVDDVRMAIAGRRIGPDQVDALCEWLGRTPSFFDLPSNGDRMEAAR